MTFVIQIIIAIVSLYVAEATRKFPDPPKTPGLDDFQAPTVDASRKYPVFWGRPVLRGPNLTWYGALWTSAIEKRVKGLFGSDKYQVGHKFHLGLHMCFGYSRGPANTRLLKILVQDTEVWSGSLTHGMSSIVKDTIFGGEDGEGGMWGDFAFYPGGPTQEADNYLTQVNILGPRVPAYRSSIRIVWRGGYLGTSKYIKEWAAQIESLPSRLGSGFHNIDGEANPAEILYELLVDPLFGLNESPLNIDIPSFLIAAAQLHAESFGMSLIWDGSRPMSDIVREIEKHIDGALFKNVHTGKWELVLNRRLSEAAMAALPVFTRDDCRIESFSRPTQDELVNEVYVNWTQGGDTSKVPVRAKNLATLEYHSNQVIQRTKNYLGVTKHSLADRLAWRDMASEGAPLDRLKMVINRKGYALKPYSKFRLEWDSSLPQLADCYVVVEIDYGTLDDQSIYVDAVQDVFDLAASLNVGGSGSEPPLIDRNPLVPENYRIMFTPYWLLSIQSDVDHPESTVPMLMVESPSPSHLQYQVSYTDPRLSSAYAQAPTPQPFTPTARLMFDVRPGLYNLRTSGDIVVHNLQGLQSPQKPASEAELKTLGIGLIMINNEFMGITNVITHGNGVWTLQVERAILDTPMASLHEAGDRVWFVGAGVGRTPSEYHPWQTGLYAAKALPVTSAGPIDEADAPVMSITSASLSNNVRPLWSYPVRYLGIFSSRTGATIANNATALPVAWNHPNRMQEQGIRFHAETSSATAAYAAEPDVTYKCYLYNSEGVLLAESPALTGSNSYSFDINQVQGQELPRQGYVQVAAVRPVYGEGERATVWFSLNQTLQGYVDTPIQEIILAHKPSAFWRLNN